MASTSASSTAIPPGSAALAEPFSNLPVSELEQNTSRQSPTSTSSPIEENYPSIHGLSGRSPVMRRLIQQMQRMAPHLSLATVEGEEGTGRTLAARALHAAGPASRGPFIPCLAIQFFSPPSPDAIGPEKLHRWSAAILRDAHGGMLFVDRVHQLSAEQQERLADFLHWFDDQHFQSHHRRPSPGDATMRRGPEEALPAQIVFSTSIPLRNPGTFARFREGLASRLCSVRFHLPPLSQRREDIPLLAQIFVQRFARVYGKPVRGLGPGAIAPLLRYSWPRNVRELEETITAAALETESQWIRPIDLPPLTATTRQSQSSKNCEASDEPDFNLDHAIRNHVAQVLAHARGNKLRAAKLLGISRSTLYRILAAQPGDAASTARQAGF